jgi:hypothetical protein
MITNLLSAEPLLLARLRARLPAPVQVFAAADLDGVREREQYAPAVHLLYGGHRIGDSPYPGVEKRLQSWVCVLVARNRRGVESQRDAAGELLTQVETSLLGWRPSPDHTPRIGQDAPAPRYGAGVIYLTLGYQTSVRSSKARPDPLTLRGRGLSPLPGLRHADGVSAGTEVQVSVDSCQEETRQLPTATCHLPTANCQLPPAT